MFLILPYFLSPSSLVCHVPFWTLSRALSCSLAPSVFQHRDTFDVDPKAHESFKKAAKQTFLDGTSTWKAKIAITGKCPTVKLAQRLSALQEDCLAVHQFVLPSIRPSLKFV